MFRRYTEPEISDLLKKSNAGREARFAWALLENLVFPLLREQGYWLVGAPLEDDDSLTWRVIAPEKIEPGKGIPKTRLITLREYRVVFHGEEFLLQINDEAQEPLPPEAEFVSVSLEPWKIVDRVSEVTRKSLFTERLKQCPACGKSFMDSSPNVSGVYCSPTCRARLMQRRHRERKSKKSPIGA